MFNNNFLKIFCEENNSDQMQSKESKVNIIKALEEKGLKTHNGDEKMFDKYKENVISLIISLVFFKNLHISNDRIFEKDSQFKDIYNTMKAIYVQIDKLKGKLKIKNASDAKKVIKSLRKISVSIVPTDAEMPSTSSPEILNILNQHAFVFYYFEDLLLNLNDENFTDEKLMLVLLLNNLIYENSTYCNLLTTNLLFVTSQVGSIIFRNILPGLVLRDSGDGILKVGNQAVVGSNSHVKHFVGADILEKMHNECIVLYNLIKDNKEILALIEKLDKVELSKIIKDRRKNILAFIVVSYILNQNNNPTINSFSDK